LSFSRIIGTPSLKLFSCSVKYRQGMGCDMWATDYLGSVTQDSLLISCCWKSTLWLLLGSLQTRRSLYLLSLLSSSTYSYVIRSPSLSCLKYSYSSFRAPKKSSLIYVASKTCTVFISDLFWTYFASTLIRCGSVDYGDGFFEGIFPAVAWLILSIASTNGAKPSHTHAYCVSCSLSALCFNFFAGLTLGASLAFLCGDFFS